MGRVPVGHARGEEAVFFEELARGRIAFQVCEDCGAAIWYLRTVCPVCMGASLRLEHSAGLGTVHSLTTLHRAGNAARADEVPYTVALVELDEGIRIIGDLAPGVAIDDRVVAEVATDGILFRAAAGAAR